MSAGWVVSVLVLYAFVVVYDDAMFRRPYPPREGPLWPVLAACVALGTVVPPSLVYARLIFVVLGVILAAKTYDLARRRISDPAMLRTFGRFVLWLSTPQDARAPRDAADAAAARAEGRRRLLRCVAKGIGAWVLLAIEDAHPWLHDHVLLETQWAMWLTYMGISGIADAMSGLAMQAGFHLGDIFVLPVAARSPRDFWGRRWNLFVHRFALRNLFQQLGGRRRPLLATALVFLASGMLHEYFVLVSLGRPSRHTGAMMLFFAVHGAAVIGQAVAQRRLGWRRPMPRALAVSAHFVWLSVTAPLFFAPIAEIFAPR